jgi:hypothetical protein
MKSLLFGQRLGDDSPDILVAHGVHRLVIPEVIAL